MLSAWASNIIAPACMNIPCIALMCKSKKSQKYSICFFYNTRTSNLFLGFRYCELRNIYKRIPNHVRIPLYSSEFVPG